MNQPAPLDVEFVDRRIAHRFRWSGNAPTGDDALTVTAPDGFASFGFVRVLLTAFRADDGHLPADLEARFHEALEQAVPEFLGLRPRRSGHFYDADAVGSSVVRRISRESIHLSDAVDGLARLVVALCAGHRGPVVMRGADRIDRPSMRVLFRAVQLADDPLRWDWQFDAPVFVDGALPDEFFARRFARSRHRLFTLLAERLGPRLEGLPEGPVVVPDLAPDGTEAVRAVAAELVGQNYDRAYLRGRAGIAATGTGDAAAHIYRMLCIVDANVGEIDLAAESMERALAHADSVFLQAHCHYMTGLLLTKRRYDLDGAEDQYRRGLDLLGAVDAPGGHPDSEVHLERAWLTNGLGLVRALRCKSLDVDERDVAVKEIFIDEVGAYQSVAGQTTAHALYLQLNLLANMTLLLEINADHERAAWFWSQVFDRFRGTASAEQRTFEVAFRYRLAMLLSKAGHHERACEHTAVAVTVSDPHRHRFTHQRMLVVHAWVHDQAGRREEAFAGYRAAAELAADLRDRRALWHAALGAAGTAPATDAQAWRDVAARVGATAREAGDPAELTRPPQPPPKFPSYIPLIDLEATPIVDLNRYLANDDSRRDLGEVVAARSGGPR